MHELVLIANGRVVRPHDAIAVAVAIGAVRSSVQQRVQGARHVFVDFRISHAYAVEVVLTLQLVLRINFLMY